MANDPLTVINLRTTPQTESYDPTQVKNNAGGYVFAVDELDQLRRFLVLGTTGGTYYTGERELTAENASLVLDLVRTRGLDVVANVLAISLGGRAPKQNPTLFALAAAASVGDVETRQAALAVLPQVARTGTHLFTFIQYAEQMRGWGPTLRRGVASWYLDKPVEKLAYQLVKYRSRLDWTHRDVLRLAHPKIPQILAEDGKTRIDVDADAPARRAAFDFACGRRAAGSPWHAPAAQDSLRMIEGFLMAQDSPAPAVTAQLVRDYGLPWEALKPDDLTEPMVWQALLDRGMPQTALMRNLPRLTGLGLLSYHPNKGGGRGRVATVAEQLATGMAKAKVHPINVLVALRTYASGHSVKGSSTWTPAPQITDALDAGFYEAFGGVEPAGKRTLLALDVSGSMGFTPISGMPLTPREASAAMAMVTVATEPDAQVVGFTSATGARGGWNWQSENNALTPLDLSPRRRLDDVIRSISNLPFGATDCALPWTWALESGREFDTVITYTDNETWAGPIHVHQATRRYREQTGIPARSIVVGMTATAWTVNDPRDVYGLDVAGFDSAVPSLISDFSAGRI